MAKKKKGEPPKELTFEEKRNFVHKFLDKNRIYINASKATDYIGGINPTYAFSSYKSFKIPVFKAYVEPCYKLFVDFLNIGNTYESAKAHFCKYFDLFVKEQIYKPLGLYKMYVRRYIHLYKESKEKFFDKIFSTEKAELYISLVKSMQIELNDK